MPERSHLDPSETSGRLANRDALRNGGTAKETLPSNVKISIPTPDYKSQRAPETTEAGPELRWTGGPQTQKAQGRRWRNDLHPMKKLYSVRPKSNTPAAAAGRQPDPEQTIRQGEEEPKFSKFALIEVCVRIISWLAALAAFSSAIYVSVHIKSLRQAAAIGQLAALFPLIFDSVKLFSLVLEKRLTKTSSGKFWYGDMIMMGLAVAVACIFWKFGVRDGVFEPFGPANEVTVAIALMATNGAFRMIWFLIPTMLALCASCI